MLRGLNGMLGGLCMQLDKSAHFWITYTGAECGEACVIIPSPMQVQSVVRRIADVNTYLCRCRVW